MNEELRTHALELITQELNPSGGEPCLICGDVSVFEVCDRCPRCYLESLYFMEEGIGTTSSAIAEHDPELWASLSWKQQTQLASDFLNYQGLLLVELARLPLSLIGAK